MYKIKISKIKIKTINYEPYYIIILHAYLSYMLTW